eukprot:scaffold576306_cov17-Prasinocladus_malaysianus.AAC.1
MTTIAAEIRVTPAVSDFSSVAGTSTSTSSLLRIYAREPYSYENQKLAVVAENSARGAHLRPSERNVRQGRISIRASCRQLSQLSSSVPLNFSSVSGVGSEPVHGDNPVAVYKAARISERAT